MIGSSLGWVQIISPLMTLNSIMTKSIAKPNFEINEFFMFNFDDDEKHKNSIKEEYLKQYPNISDKEIDELQTLDKLNGRVFYSKDTVSEFTYAFIAVLIFLCWGILMHFDH